MRHLLVTLFAAFAVTAVHADSADLLLQPPLAPLVRAGDEIFVDLEVTNSGPDVARNTVLTIKVQGLSDPKLPCPDGRCSLGDLQPGTRTSVEYRQQLPNADLTVTFDVNLTSDIPDPIPQNNSFTGTMVVSTAPAVSAELQGPP